MASLAHRARDRLGAKIAAVDATPHATRMARRADDTRTGFVHAAPLREADLARRAAHAHAVVRTKAGVRVEDPARDASRHRADRNAAARGAALARRAADAVACIDARSRQTACPLGAGRGGAVRSVTASCVAGRHARAVATRAAFGARGAFVDDPVAVVVEVVAALVEGSASRDAVHAFVAGVHALRAEPHEIGRAHV